MMRGVRIRLSCLLGEVAFFERGSWHHGRPIGLIAFSLLECLDGASCFCTISFLLISETDDSVLPVAAIGEQKLV